ENLDEQGLAQMEVTGWLRSLEALDHRSAVLLVWARLCHAICRVDSDRAATLNELLDDLTRRWGWATNDRYDPSVRINALVLASVAARYAGRFDEADGFARKIIALQTEQANSPRRPELPGDSLLAILEQIRVLRDAGRREEALTAVDTAQTYLRKAWPDDLAAALAVDLLEWSVLAGRKAGQRGGSVLASAEALVPLEVFASKSLVNREILRAALAGALADEPIRPDLSPFALELIAGAAVSDVLDRLPPDRRASDARLAAVIDALQQVAASQPADVSPVELGEMLYLRGQVLLAAGRKLEAARALADLVERVPNHDRARAAARQAVTLVRGVLDGGQGDSAAARAAFVRAGRLLRKLMPDAPESRSLQYFIAQALEDSGMLREAADEYAAVLPEDANGPLAGLRRARCLRTLLQQAVGPAGTAPADLKSLTDETVEVARSGAKIAGTRPADDQPALCLAAEQVLLLANVLNLPVVGRSAEALDALNNFESRFDRCPGAVGQALRERIVALRQLKRMAEARQVVDLYLQKDPEQAGPVMIRLLQAMHDEIEAAEDRGDEQAVRSVAAEAAELARMLLKWSDAHPGSVAPGDGLTIAVWRAAATLHAGRPDEAIELYELCTRMAEEIQQPHEAQEVQIRLGNAEAVLAAGRPEHALTLFSNLCRRLPEESPPWWRAFVGQLRCHAALNHDSDGILQTIRQRRYLSPDLGGPRYRRTIEAVEKGALASQPPVN
ncbi:MAG TPA: hypothetical protein VLM89_02310, partial [Phycisphaerae bacterium]|nr:hypothetical protein [Phycisphaerae bacterium]